MAIYNDIIYKRKYNKNLIDWSGNNRLFGLDKGDRIDFFTSPTDRKHGIKNKTQENTLLRLLFSLYPAKNGINREKGADFVMLSELKVTYPYGYYGVIINGSDYGIFSPHKTGVFHGESNQSVWNIAVTYASLKVGDYYVYIKTDGFLEKDADGVAVKGATKTAVTFYCCEEKAKSECEELFLNNDSVTEKSQNFWEEYFNSCPIINGDKAFGLRQYWHWWASLINVSCVEFNDFPLYMAPDRPNWLGTWSNDGPESMLALCLTNQKELAKQLIKSYIDAAVNDDGIHSWYLNSDGVGCFGREGDVGVMSHGVPNIVHTLWFYIKTTKDYGILDENLRNMSVYEKICRYMRKLFALRDTDNDGLIEWRNLWETGWDDKLGCFFKGASLEEWCKMATEFSKAEQETFYKENSYPVIAVNEQYYTRLALLSLLKMAEIKGDFKTIQFCNEKLKLSKKSFYEKCYCKEDGFYHDFNIRENVQVKGKSADCFYALYFEEDKEKAKRIIEYLDDEKTFKAEFIPMQSMDTEGFSKTGYWSGGHWPREMSYVALGIANAGYCGIANEILKKSIMTGEGDNLFEVMNPIDAINSSPVTKMAYNVLEVVAMLVINKKTDWI